MTKYLLTIPTDRTRYALNVTGCSKRTVPDTWKLKFLDYYFATPKKYPVSVEYHTATNDADAFIIELPACCIGVKKRWIGADTKYAKLLMWADGPHDTWTEEVVVSELP